MAAKWKVGDVDTAYIYLPANTIGQNHPMGQIDWPQPS